MFGFGIGARFLYIHIHGCLTLTSFWQKMYRAETHFSLVCISGYIVTRTTCVRCTHPVTCATCIVLLDLSAMRKFEEPQFKIKALGNAECPLYKYARCVFGKAYLSVMTVYRTLHDNRIHHLKLAPIDFSPVHVFVAVFSNAGINLTGYHLPGLTPGPLNFFVKILSPRTAFQCKTPAPGSKKRNKIFTPGHNLPGSNAEISMKKRNIIL